MINYINHIIQHYVKNSKFKKKTTIVFKRTIRENFIKGKNSSNHVFNNFFLSQAPTFLVIWII